MPKGFFGAIPTNNEVYFVSAPYIPAIVDKCIPLKRGRDGKWNWKERAALTKELTAQRRANWDKLKEEGLRPARHYATMEAAKAFVAMVKERTGIELSASPGFYI